MSVQITKTAEFLLTVPCKISQEEILRRGDLLPRHWEHVPTLNEPSSLHRVTSKKMVLVALSERVQIKEILPLIRASTTEFSGSGAWVREAYLEQFPDYDNGGAIIFPDEGYSLWRYNLDPDKKIHTMGMWHDFGKTGRRSMDPIEDSWRAGRRIALVKN